HGRRRADVDQVGRSSGEKLQQANVQKRMVVAEIHRAKAGKAIEVLAALIVKEARSFRTHEDTPVAEEAQELDERRVDVASELGNHGMRLGGHAAASSNLGAGRPSRIRPSESKLAMMTAADIS